MIDFKVSKQEHQNDLAELVRLFEGATDECLALEVDYENTDKAFTVRLKSDKYDGFRKNFYFPFGANDELSRKRVEKRYLKIAIYRTLCFLTGVELPYGCLTGIRPTKLYSEIQNDRENYGKSAREVFLNDYGVSAEKVDLVERIVEIQRPLRNKSDKERDVFVFIPFCPTRCAYCSFVSLPLDRQRKLVEPYVECLIRELEQTRALIRRKRWKIRAVYVGGGTPTSIGADMLDRVLEHCHFKAKEFTVEAGRPDTIDKEIIEVLLKHGVTRISVNPQTFNAQTLERIGRRHKVGDTVNAYALAKGKLDINMDLIAMLPGESFDDFKFSVDTAVALAPENITVHTLYIKKGSALKLDGYDNTDCDTAAKMVDYAYKKLCAAGYAPYYMYRQKYTSGNLENVGYSKPGKECVYNIDIMEEDTSIIANGANGISKKFEADKNLITRCANYKEPLEYVKNIDLMLERQKEFWK
ncbi:MAG: coproporphyrinogen dehydrogenase HemZ [Clostridia bacterium]|jgi:oxygen-independent coproporphyrinogen-3 oxidase|nr:coproporphyrinogen dehydrogenase HemZ [Clostridia bacterium]